MKKDINECLSNPCQDFYQKRCIDLDDGFKCVCNPGYKGRHCEEIIYNCFANTCNENGYCIDHEESG